MFGAPSTAVGHFDIVANRRTSGARSGAYAHLRKLHDLSGKLMVWPGIADVDRALLVDAVRDWLDYLGIARAVATEDKGKFGHELTIATVESDQLHDLTHVGVGVCQALPIVVLSPMWQPFLSFQCHL
jgi:hypothetical protein